jgi:hypothetical protein
MAENRLDRAADLVGATRRWLICQSAQPVGDERRASTHLGWALERLRDLREEPNPGGDEQRG